MVKILRLNLLLTLLLLGAISIPVEAQWLLQRKLRKIPGVVSVVKTENTVPHLNHKFEILFEQPVDHQNPGEGTFLQRIFLGHVDFSAPVEFVTEGYDASYAADEHYVAEIAALLSANQIVVEHRYFGESVPAGFGWDLLTVEQAAADHHRIVQSFRKVYRSKWIATGISKGGTAAMIHRTIYPADVDITVAYVAPLNYGLVDGRHERHIATAPDPEYRQIVFEFQKRVLQHRDSIMPFMMNYIREKNLTFRITPEELFDFVVLEYSFAFFQWGWEYYDIPIENVTARELFRHLIQVSPPEYFAISERYLPFFVQASRQLGYYGYDPRSLMHELVIDYTDGYLQQVFLPDSVQYTFDLSVTQMVQAFLDSTDHKMIFIYGELDPWTASAVVFDWRIKENMYKFVKPLGTHKVRINNLPNHQRDEVLRILTGWLRPE